MLEYAIIIMPDDNGTLLVTCPDLPEVTSFGEDESDALLRAVDAIEEALAARIAAKKDIPEPEATGTLVTLPALVSVKVGLYQEMRRSGMRKSDLARKLRMHAPQVDRLLDLHHASRLDQMEAALGALGKHLDIRIGG